MATPIPANTVGFLLKDVVEITGAQVDGDVPLERECCGISTDTRQLTEDSLFIALRGETMDGAKFVQKAREMGAICAIVHHDSEGEFGPCLRVKDTLKALGDLAQAYQRRVRAKTGIPVLAVGGAAGKTTTKELAACAARALFGEVLSTQGNLNNLIGVPMTLFTLGEHHRAAVIEVGTNSRGEIPRLGAIVEPTVSLVLNVDAEHTEGLGTIDDVADEEGALFAHAQRVCIANLDEALSYSRSDRRADGVKLRTFSEAQPATVQLQKRVFAKDGTSVLSLLIAPELLQAGAPTVHTVSFSLLGQGPAIDTAAALAAVLSMLDRGASQAQLDRVFTAISQISPVPGRLVPKQTAEGVLVIDDTYNANPRSVQLSIETGSDLARLRGGQLHVILGDMLELGELGPSLHAELAPYIVRSQCKTFATVGPLMALAARAVVREAAEGKSSAIVLECASPEDAAVAVKASIAPGDVVVIKGSRGMRTERAIPVFFASSTAQQGVA